MSDVNPNLLLRRWPTGSLAAATRAEGGGCLVASFRHPVSGDVGLPEWVTGLRRLAGHPQYAGSLELRIQPEGVQWFCPDLAGIPVLTPADPLPLDPSLAASCAVSLLRALVPLHESGIPSLGLRPYPLLCSADGARLLLAEPGVGHALLGSVSTQGSLRRQLPSLLGMPVWMAPPELWTDRTQVTPAADIFCLGALMAWWLTGQHPFGQGMSLEVQNRMLRKQLPGLQTALGRIPASLYQFLEDCLDPNPQLRPPNATLALAREALAEGKEGPLPTVEGGVSLPYSCFFPEAGTLSPGEDLFGLVQESAAPPGGPRGEDTMDPEVQRLLALLPVRDKSTRTPGGKKGRMVSWIAAIVLVLLAVALFPMVLDQLGSAHRPHEGPVPPDAEGLTHDDLWTPGERSESNPTVAYLLSGISHPLKSELTVLGGFWDTPFDLRVPAIPPYSLVSNSASQTMELRFSARNRLDRMILLGPDGKPRIWQLLYDGGGRPKVLRSLSGEVPEWKVLGP